MRLRSGLAVALAVAGCGGKSKPEETSPPVPTRAATAGDEILALMPDGADLVLEIDLARLRANPVAGPVVAAVEGGDADPGERVILGLGSEIWRRADTVVMASYATGTAAAATLVAVRGGALEGYELSGGERLDSQTVVVGTPELVAAVAAVAASERTSLAADDELARLRAWAMPAKARGASLRLVARLSFDARVTLASRFDLDAAPASLSLWSDVADDLALVALLGGDDEEEAERLAVAVARLRARLVRDPVVRWLGLAPLAGLLEVEKSSNSARVTFIVGPTRLNSTATRLVRRLGGDGGREL